MKKVGDVLFIMEEGSQEKGLRLGEDILYYNDWFKSVRTSLINLV